jgi:hypothetical protein
MGCTTYDINEKWAKFSEGDDGCLCTFPYNDGMTLDLDRLRLLAYLGAAVTLLHSDEYDCISIPNDLGWIKDEIDRLTTL